MFLTLKVGKFTKEASLTKLIKTVGKTEAIIAFNYLLMTNQKNSSFKRASVKQDHNTQKQ